MSDAACCTSYAAKAESARYESDHKKDSRLLLPSWAWPQFHSPLQRGASALRLDRAAYTSGRVTATTMTRMIGPGVIGAMIVVLGMMDTVATTTGIRLPQT